MSQTILQKVFFALEKVSGDLSQDIENLTNLMVVDNLPIEKLRQLADTIYGDVGLEVKQEVEYFRFFLRNVASLLKIKGTHEALVQASEISNLIDSLTKVNTTEMFKSQERAYKFLITNSYPYVIKSSKILFTDDNGNILTLDQSRALYEKLKAFLPINVRVPPEVVVIEPDDQFPTTSEGDITDYYMDLGYEGDPTTGSGNGVFPIAYDFLFISSVYANGIVGGNKWACGSCENACQACQTQDQFCSSYCQTNIQEQCRESCQSMCQLQGCQSCCEMLCQETCELTCEAACTNISKEQHCYQACEVSCQLTCTLGSCQQWCELHCQQKCEFPGCEAGCQVACQLNPCEMACQANCQSVCVTGCEVFCEEACQLCKQGCKITCQVACEDSCIAPV